MDRSAEVQLRSCKLQQTIQPILESSSFLKMCMVNVQSHNQTNALVQMVREFIDTSVQPQWPTISKAIDRAHSI